MSASGELVNGHTSRPSPVHTAQACHHGFLIVENENSHPEDIGRQRSNLQTAAPVPD
jgi:hypothetical protein